LQFPQHLPFDWDHIREVINSADVLHGHDHRVQVDYRQADVVTFHGTGFRENPDMHLADIGDAKALVATLDLWLQKPLDVEWMPQMDDLDWLATFRKPQKRLTIGHFPTNPAIKSTAEFVAACELLQQTYDLDFIVGQGKSWLETLRVKGTCDILFDQTTFGYGGNAIEAWAMNIPVISGGADELLEEFDRRFGYVPFVQTRADTISSALLTLMDPDARTTWGQLGRTHVERFHSYEVGAERLATIYRELT
jgi:glycosyltransferase involved in cell wall biosynthesis